MQLVWFDSAIAGRLRRRQDWRALLLELEQRAIAERLRGADLPSDFEDRRETLEVLGQAKLANGPELSAALERDLSGDGQFEPEVFALAGTLSLEFDELRRLEATIATATPFAEAGDSLERAIVRARSFVEVAGKNPAPDLANRLALAIREAFDAAQRSVDLVYIDAQIRRTLLQSRAFQVREVMGRACLRSTLRIAGSDRSMPVYFAKESIKLLPLFEELVVRVLAEVHPQADQGEAYGPCLFGLALGRLADAQPAQAGTRQANHYA